MGFLIKIGVVFLVFYLLFRFLVRFFLGNIQKRNYDYRSRGTNNQRAQNQEKKTETQEERILEYQKRSFESADAYDVEFEEIKD